MRIRTKKVTETITVERGGEIATFECEPLNLKEEEKLRRKHDDYKKVKGQVLPDPAFLKQRIEKVQKVIKSWDLKDEDGSDVECSDTMKEVAFINNAALINEVLEKLDEKVESKIAVEQEKKTTSSIG